MPQRFFDDLDWSQPWFASVRAAVQPLLAAPDWRLCLNQLAATAGLQNHRTLPLQFVPQADLPDGVAYEQHISQHGQVPTRENLHDFFNALVWLSFPRIKRQLNALQAAQIAALGIGKSRGPARDAATIFDENSALLVVQDAAAGRALAAALRQHDWDYALRQQAALFGTQAEVHSFGHALMEKLVRPYKSITAHAWIVWVDAAYFGWDAAARRAHIDELVTRQLQQHDLTTAAYTPLPVSGIPGWWPQQDAAFYADAAVFRPQRVSI